LPDLKLGLSCINSDCLQAPNRAIRLQQAPNKAKVAKRNELKKDGNQVERKGQATIQLQQRDDGHNF
jgi:hypothetical protein